MMTEENFENSKISTSQDETDFLNSSIPSTSEEKINALFRKVKKIETELLETKTNFEKSRNDLITILSIFVGFITFVGIEFQAFNKIQESEKIIGLTLLFLSSILLFVHLIDNVIKTQHMNWKFCRNPLFVILILMLVFSTYLMSKNNKIIIKCYEFEKKLC